MAITNDLQAVSVIHRVIRYEKYFRSNEHKERGKTEGDPENGFESGVAGTVCKQGRRCHQSGLEPAMTWME